MLALPNGQSAWVAAERLPAIRVLFPNATIDPVIEPPSGVRIEWETTDARISILRGWLEVCGPITAAELAEQTSFTESQISATLEALEGEGTVLRGSFREKSCELLVASGELKTEDIRPSDAELATNNSPLTTSTPSPPEWCHRRLLARIHRLTIEGLRRLIEPVDASTYWRYLSRRQGITSSDKRAGSNGVFEVIAMLQGLDIAAVAWERDVLSVRVAEYRPEWLDELCLGGEVGWGRLYPPRSNPEKAKPLSGITRVVPVSLFLRADLPWLDTIEGMVSDRENELQLSSSAEDLAALLRSRGAMFLSDLLRESHSLPAHVEDGLGELVSCGLVTADGFAGLRQLISELSHTSSSRGASRRRPGLLRQRGPTGSSGRWSLWREEKKSGELKDISSNSQLSRSDVVEQWVWQLLRRWGVVFKDLLTRESGTPSWFELLQVYRRLEARGEIRGGRFISGVAGEQFSMSESIRQLRLLRDNGPQHELVLVSSADPLNLAGIVDELPRVPSIASHRLAYLDGRCVGTMIAEEKWLSPTLDDQTKLVVVELLERGRPGQHSPQRKETSEPDRRTIPSRPRAAVHARGR